MDEASLGQLFQMLMIATVAEGRLMGINPYGQPGVEAYKNNMNAILRGKEDEGRIQNSESECRMQNDECTEKNAVYNNR